MAFITRNIDGTRTELVEAPFRTTVQAYGNEFIVQGDVYTETPILGIPGFPPTDAPITLSFDAQYRGKMGDSWYQAGLGKFELAYGNLIQSFEQYNFLVNGIIGDPQQGKIVFQGFEAWNGVYATDRNNFQGENSIFYLEGDGEKRIQFDSDRSAWVLYYNLANDIAYLTTDAIDDPSQTWESIDYDVLSGTTILDFNNIFSSSTIDFSTQLAYFSWFRGSSAGFRINSTEAWSQKLGISTRATADIRPPPYSYLIGSFSRNALKEFQGAYMPWIQVNQSPVISTPFINKLRFLDCEIGDGEYVRDADRGVDSTFYNFETNNYIVYQPALGGWTLVWDDESELVAICYGDANDPSSLTNWESYNEYGFGEAEASYWSQTSINPWIPAS